MTFTDSIKTCLKKYFVFSGRAKRSEYWWFQLFYQIADIFGHILDAYFLGLDITIDRDPAFFETIFTLGLIIPSIAVGARRLHDINKSGWLLLLTITFFLLQYSLIISLEEEVLKNKFGKEYDLYKESVPRLIPTVLPWSDRIIIKPRSWRKTFMIERRTLQSMLFSLLIILLRSLLII